MTVPSAEELDSFKYSDLQNLAKRLGLRANLRADKLLKALKAHLKHEERKENKDESQTSGSSKDETMIQINSHEQTKREPIGNITKTRRCKTVHGHPDSQQDHSEVKMSDDTEFQNQEKQKNQDLGTTAKVPSLPDQSQGDDNVVSSGKSEMNDNEDSKGPSERKSLYTDGFSKLGNNKRTTVTTPNFKKLHEARFKEMESIDEYIKRKKKHFEDHNSFHELKKQPGNKGGVVTPVPPKGRLSVTCTPINQQRSKGQSHGPASRSTRYLRGSVKHSALSAAKMSVRFSAATKDNEHKHSMIKTPARKSPHVTTSGKTSEGHAVPGTPNLKTNRENSAAVITPFKLTTMAMQTPVSNKKPVFDLKASLSRPLNYEPHKGKLKPWGKSKENNSLNEHVDRVTFHKKTYKQPHLQTREEQRKKQEQERKEKKAKVLEARRGFIILKDE
ncbi:nucleolar and spindle-associated protein 1 isoform X1 [Ictidomys tridecemlineatus]|uniref:nucleolar and spindle-associated protein 1 isoform X1 n=1 Tax=Ictidomys tridecemlineatus TaxID=43179 RepID=UPI000B545C38|nr:nucleolar and spindle-associated protein 1 isoform X1 [Ictidomys tridecemlineatus]KAG3261643.1 nucleolar and spindle associated protein 1 [Ictidomys tridecemlineatus]